MYSHSLNLTEAHASSCHPRLPNCEPLYFKLDGTLRCTDMKDPALTLDALLPVPNTESWWVDIHITRWYCQRLTSWLHLLSSAFATEQFSGFERHPGSQLVSLYKVPSKCLPESCGMPTQAAVPPSWKLCYPRGWLWGRHFEAVEVGEHQPLPPNFWLSPTYETAGFVSLMKGWFVSKGAPVAIMTPAS